jgi:hypothetical protein
VGRRTAGDKLLEQYLDEHGFDALEHEPDVGTAKRPDYVIRRGASQLIVEVKEFSPGTSSLPAQTSGTTSLEVVLKPIRSQLREAARQLKDVADLGLPLMVVLTNPHGAFVIMGEQELIWAMYGDPVIRMAIDPRVGAAVGDPEYGVGRNGRLARDHQYISAVGVLRQRSRASDWHDALIAEYADMSWQDRWRKIEEAEARGERPEGDYRSIDVFKTLSPSAVPLPAGFFTGPSDRLFEPNQDGTAYIEVTAR